MTPRSLALASLAALAFAAAPASAAVAPGRIAFSVATRIPESNVDAGGAGPAVALPDGGAVMLASDRGSKGITAVQLRADGSLDPTFGSGGIARVPMPVPVFSAQQLLRQPDGRLLVVGTGTAASRYELPRFVIARLTAGGAPDPSFGAGGFVAPALQSSCGSCEAAALAPDGAIVLTGNTGQGSPQSETNPNASAGFRWVVQRLTPAGAQDASFGTVTIPGTNGLSTGGFGTVVRPSGAIVVLGSHRGIEELAGLTAVGAPDPTFNGGQPATVPTDGFRMLLRTSGAIDVMGNGRLARFTVAGALDAAYGAGGTVTFGGFDPATGPPSMLAAPDGGTTLYRTPTFESTPAGQARLRIQRITPSGTLGASADLEPAFGGGLASPLARITGSVAQNNFHGALLARPDGSYLAVGGLSIVRYTGEGEGSSAGFVAVAAYTPLLVPDTSFGGPQQPALARVRVPRQRASSDVRLGRVLARVTASAPGLVQLRVRDGRRRILAQSVAPLYAAGTTSVRIALTKTGRRVLRRARNVRVQVGHDFRDVLTGRDHGATAARLR
jgi:uncharacterized delta-60 repeat protein